LFYYFFYLKYQQQDEFLNVSNIFMKLGVQSRVEAVTLALQRKMID